MTKILVYINFILTIGLIALTAWVLINQNNLSKTISNLPPLSSQENNLNSDHNISYVDRCGEDCKKEISSAVKLAVSNTDLDNKDNRTIISVTPQPQTKKMETTYIPLNGSISTTSSDWYNAPGTEFYLDFNTDYGKSAYANWEAFLKVAHGNGTAYARLFDITNGIAVNGSEIKIENKSDLTQVSSGALSFWAGNNQYRVQIKSLNTFEVTFGGGRVKIVY